MQQVRGKEWRLIAIPTNVLAHIVGNRGDSRRECNRPAKEIVGSTSCASKSSRGTLAKKCLINTTPRDRLSIGRAARACVTCVRVRKRTPAFCQRRALIPSCTRRPFVSPFFPSVFSRSSILSPLSSPFSTNTHTHTHAGRHARTCVLSTRKSYVYHSTAASPIYPLFTHHSFDDSTLILAM